MSLAREPNAEPLAGYRLIEPLGSGGFGEVWKCEAPGGLFKAIKFVYGNLNSLDVEGARAEQELQALQRIKEVRHPFVLSLDRIEIVEGQLLIVMELADRSLHDSFVECQSAGQVGIPREALLRYIRDAAEALDHMNEKHNLQHLDIKPRNLFLVSGRVKVADFGLVKHLERSNSAGIPGGVTPLYAPPETLTGKISQSSDQYSLAIVYQELLTGQRPFNGTNPRQLAQQHLQDDPELRPLPEAERPIVARALAKDPAKRFPTCLTFVRALFSAQGRSRPATMGPEPVAAALDKPSRVLADTLEDIQLELDMAQASEEETPSPPEEPEELSRLGITMAQPQSGALRPTVIVGVGSLGRRALLELRSRFIDRLGDLNKIPLLRFVYLETDPDAVQSAFRGTPEVALSRNEVHHLPLQPVGNYRRRMLDYLSEWLPREKLYSISRALQTQGCRALGRLAFVDNHLRLMARLRREVQQAVHPNTLYQSVSQTGLALRDGVPRIYIIAAAGGGSSGFLVDLGYGLRRLMQHLRYEEAEVVLFLFCGAPSDPATPRGELANVYATLTELNHFADPTIPFAAQYGADGPRLIDQGQSYTASYLFQLSHRSPEALRDAVAHLGSYLFHELTTPLGMHLDRDRHAVIPPGACNFRSFGTYAVWFPRGLLLRLAARQACQQLIAEWRAEGEPTAQAEVEAACARVLADTELRPESLGLHIEEDARPILGGAPAEALTSLLAALEEQSQQSVAQEDPGHWARQALTRILEWGASGSPAEANGQGVGATCGEWRKSRLSRALGTAAESLAQTWDERLAETAFGLMEHPGRRVAAAEAALAQFACFCEEAIASHGARAQQQAVRTQKAWHSVETALESCLAEAGGGGGLSAILLFGNRTRRILRVFMDHLAAFARQCLAEETINSAQHFFVSLNARIGERLRQMGFCRQRLRHLQESLEGSMGEDQDSSPLALRVELTPSHSPLPSPEAFWESIRQSATIRVVLPDGEADLERAALRFAGTLGSPQQIQLDQALQDCVLAPRGGLHAACAGSSDLVRTLALPLLDQAATFLSELLPITDVAQVEQLEAQGPDGDLSGQIRDYFARARPLVPGKDSKQRTAYLLVPASDAGKNFGEQAQQAQPDLQLVLAPGQAHLMFCREQGYLSNEDLEPLLRPCRTAYEDLALVPNTSPHARFDIVDWMPLDP
jgi:hypothetical protein